MRSTLLLAAAVAALLPASLTAAQEAPAAAPAAPISPEPATPAEAAIKAHVAFLSADVMKGREAGSPEYDIAAHYVASQFMAAGLKPGGDAGGYLQAVPLVSYRAKEGARVALGADVLVAGDDVTVAANPASATTRVTAPVVFAGQGIVAPAYKRDDYAALDVRGKIVALVAGTPTDMTGEERAFFGSPATKARLAAQRGAVGIVILARPGVPDRRAPAPAPTPTAAAKPGAAPAPAAAPAAPRRMIWANPDGTGHAERGSVPVLANFTVAGARKLFAAAGQSWDKLGGAKAKLRPLALPTPLTIESATEFEPVRSFNVVGVLPGSDPALAKEVVVLSGHLDHIGVGKPDAKGDAINNGALDDAIGTASVIEAAKRFAAAPRPKRTVVFLAVTAEEKGLVGSDYFVQHRPAGLENIVADVNLDMPILTYRFEDLVAFGGDRSTLGPIIARAAQSAGVVMSPDPMPEEGIFVRSDHFRFVQQGVPSIFLWPGQKGPGKAAVAEFMGKCYHRPCDQLSQQPILWDQAVRFVDLNFRIAREIADAPAKPVWNKGDYFGTTFNGPMAQ